MTVEEIYTYIDSAKSFIEKRAEYNQKSIALQVPIKESVTV